MKYLLIAVGIAVLSCAPKPRENEKTVIDIDGMINRQLDLLQQRSPSLTKAASVDASASDTTWRPSASAWRNELEIFRALGTINQQIYSGTYSIEGPMDDPQSNLLIRRFANPSSPLRWLRIFYHDDPSRIRQLEGVVEEKTPLFAAQRRLSLWFEDEQGLLLLSRFEIIGYQKAALRDTVHFRVHGEVGW